MPLQRMLAGAGGGIPDLNCAVTAPGGDGRRILVEGYGIDRTPSKLRRLKKKINCLGLGLLAVLVHRFLPVSVTGVVSPGYDLRNVCLFRPVTLWTRIHQTFSHLRMPVHTAPGVGRVIGLCL